MALGSMLAIYFIIWWLVLFAVLPFGVKSQEEAGDAIEPGSMPGAPSRPMLARKAVATTIVSAIIFAAVYWLLVYSGLTLDDVPIPGRF
ncbi:DUF1467 family protein [Breoghania sp. L-A4]|uniref:DUF1467 family protein n=1 Tax=Breoghania sp. L-A4 TaxID=2304600 RepID=UPI000E35F4D7|nr:DUF1467 family protein [Breoghania sp. L-A4]AXS40403.1 DUF1467 family protein [Breoghania sp. L-A4]